MEHHQREAAPGGHDGAPSKRDLDERAREYERYEDEERKRLENYENHLTERERRERFPIG